MGEATDQTRLAIEARRAEIEASVAQLRDSLDLRRRLRENPGRFVAIGAAAAFLLVGGPTRAVRFARRRLMRTQPEKAYDRLPRTLQKWVDEMAGTVGPRAEEARQTLSSEFLRWRHDPKGDKKFRRELAKQMVEGPPGANRTAWKAFEAAAAIITAALARKFVEQFLAGEPPSGMPALDAVGTAGGAAEPDEHPQRAGVPGSPRPDPVRAGNREAGYSSMSRRSVDGPN